ncbi:MAG: RecQ family ATP-dependent DNA helicase [Lachnospiraceae bacterium]|jgi:ATP-dependent DNA helicase RecQ
MKKSDINSGKAALKRYFGYDSFRPGQERAVSAILKGRDFLGIMPTGAGKSVCYQIPALLLPGCAIVISPLVSLMQDQVNALIAKGIPASYINSSLTPSRQKAILEKTVSGSIKLLYASPERLDNKTFRSYISRAVISFICVDEAHCISVWGMNFRPEYRKIGSFAEYLGRITGRRINIAAFTATADPRTRDDIIASLNLDDPFIMTTGFDRPNLYFEIRYPKDKLSETERIVSERTGKCGIIYCLTRKQCEFITKYLVMRGIPAVMYHGGMTAEKRCLVQNDFSSGKINLIVATNAFGMGIDKDNIRFIVHYALPANMENYYQEAGRAGRDGGESECILLYGHSDVSVNLNLITEEPLSFRDKISLLLYRTGISPSLPPQMLHLQKCYSSLHEMVRYAAARQCLRKSILSHFSDNRTEHTAAVRCKKCSFCLKRDPSSGLGITPDSCLDLLINARRRLALRYKLPEKKIIPEKVLLNFSRVLPDNYIKMIFICEAGPFAVWKYGKYFLEIIETVIFCNREK